MSSSGAFSCAAHRSLHAPPWTERQAGCRQDNRVEQVLRETGSRGLGVRYVVSARRRGNDSVQVTLCAGVADDAQSEINIRYVSAWPFGDRWSAEGPTVSFFASCGILGHSRLLDDAL